MAELIRNISYRTALAVVIGGVIGSGIFMKPAFVAGVLGDPVLLLSVWVVAGLITLCGALSNAEVAAMFPETGGQYVFFSKMYGNAFAFLYGWASFAVFNTAGNASIAYVVSDYIDYYIPLYRLPEHISTGFRVHIPLTGNIFPLQDFGVKVLTALILGVLTWLNCRSVTYSGGLQRFLTLLKAIAIIMLVTGLFASGKGDVSHFGGQMTADTGFWPKVTAYAAALSAVFWAYDGWNNITFIAGEVKEPQKNIPKSLLAGLAFCILMYFLINLAMLYIWPVEKLAGSKAVAADIASFTWGPAGGLIIAAMVVISVLGTLNANVLSTARVTYAMGGSHKWFSFAGKPHATYMTPANALILNAAWSIILVFSGSFDMLTDMLIFVTWAFYAASALGLFILRKKYPDHPRPYRVTGYPVIPAVFVLFAVLFLAITLIGDISDYLSGKSQLINSVLGIAITAAGIIPYLAARTGDTHEQKHTHG